jgi:hypothetical protein
MSGKGVTPSLERELADLGAGRLMSSTGALID